MTRRLPLLAACAFVVLVTGAAARAGDTHHDNNAEVRLIEIYQLIARGEATAALPKASALARDYPQFQLAQLALGDLYAGRTRVLRSLGDAPREAAGGISLKELRDEARLRVAAQQSKPQPGTIPAQFAALAPGVRHAIAVDASLSRLYLLENSPGGLKPVADYYVSLGKLGLEKATEGDRRTPLGVYFVTNHLPQSALADQYGAGALPLSYPSPYDQRRGKSGGGIWLHGTPSQQYARAPWATDGCIVLSNDDMRLLIANAQIRATPVVIAPSLRWVAPQQAQSATAGFNEALGAFKKAKSEGNLQKVMGFYAPDFESRGRKLNEWAPSLSREMATADGRPLEFKDLSVLNWNDKAEVMVVTFGQVVRGERKGITKRQYWIRQNQQWKIFFEGDQT